MDNEKNCQVEAEYRNNQKMHRYNATNGNNLYKIPTSRTLLSRIVLELVVVTILGYPMLHIYVLLKGNVEPYSRGFFCDDENLKHPFIEEEISITDCVVIWFGIVLTVVPLVEVIHFAMFDYTEWEHQMRSRNDKGLLGCFSRIPVIVIELYRMLGYFFIGALGCLLTTELAKYKIGRLRPYYLTVCNISLTEELCEDENKYKKFVEPPHNCIPRVGDPNPEHTINEAKKSFMSGHSSFSFYCATYLVIYLHARLSRTSHCPAMKKKPTPRAALKVTFRILRILRPFLQFVFYILAIYIALSRISDYRHHPTDVITGIILGNLFAFLILYLTVDLFRRPRSFYHARYTAVDHIIQDHHSDTEKGVYEVDGVKPKAEEVSESHVECTKDITSPLRVKQRFDDANQRVEALISSK